MFSAAIAENSNLDSQVISQCESWLEKKDMILKIQQSARMSLLIKVFRLIIVKQSQVMLVSGREQV